MLFCSRSFSNPVPNASVPPPGVLSWLVSWCPQLWSCPVTLLWLPSCQVGNPFLWLAFPLWQKTDENNSLTPFSLSLLLDSLEDSVAFTCKLGEIKWDAQEQLLPPLPHFDSWPAHREWDFSAPRVMFPMRKGPARSRLGGKGYLTLGFIIMYLFSR